MNNDLIVQNSGVDFCLLPKDDAVRTADERHDYVKKLGKLLAEHRNRYLTTGQDVPTYSEVITQKFNEGVSLIPCVGLYSNFMKTLKKPQAFQETEQLCIVIIEVVNKRQHFGVWCPNNKLMKNSVGVESDATIEEIMYAYKITGGYKWIHLATPKVKLVIKDEKDKQIKRYCEANSIKPIFVNGDVRLVQQSNPSILTSLFGGKQWKTFETQPAVDGVTWKSVGGAIILSHSLDSTSRIQGPDIYGIVEPEAPTPKIIKPKDIDI